MWFWRTVVIVALDDENQNATTNKNYIIVWVWNCDGGNLYRYLFRVWEYIMVVRHGSTVLRKGSADRCSKQRCPSTVHRPRNGAVASSQFRVASWIRTGYPFSVHRSPTSARPVTSAKMQLASSKVKKRQMLLFRQSSWSESWCSCFIALTKNEEQILALELRTVFFGERRTIQRWPGLTRSFQPRTPDPGLDPGWER